MKYKLEKIVWTHNDFEVMGWHDNTMYGFVLEEVEEWSTRLLFDIDYIFKWELQKNNYYNFWISPCTLSFEDVFDLNINIKIEHMLPTPFVIDCIGRQDDKWVLELHAGTICFTSSGFTQIVRKEPSLSESQSLTMQNRGGFSFSMNY